MNWRFKYPRQSAIPLLLTILLFCLTPALSQTTLSVSLGNENINANTIYTYTIVFSNTTNRINLTLFFPPKVTLSNTTTVSVNTIPTLNTSQYAVYPSNNSILINRNLPLSSSNSTIVTINNVKNPPSAIQTTSFSITTTFPSDSVSLIAGSYIQYISGSLQSCTYSFSGTTQQSNSILNMAAVLGNPIPVGSNTVAIYYPKQWQNSNKKSLTSNSETINCNYTTDKITYYSGNCTFDSSAIYFTFSADTIIPANTTLTVQVNGINCPPTVTTTTSSSFKVITMDSSSNYIDTKLSCTINPTTISTINGNFTNSVVSINTLYSFPAINFTSPAPVAFQVGDTIQLTYEPTLVCPGNNLTIYRSQYIPWAFASSSSGVRSYNGTFTTDNIHYTSNIQLYLDCNINSPPSSQPTTFVFTFYRAGSAYLNLTATLTAIASVIKAENFNVVPATTSAVVSSSYTFSLVLSQPISSVAMIYLYLPLGLDLSNFQNRSSCSGSRNSVTLSISDCNFTTSSGSIIIYIYLSEAATIASGITLSLVMTHINNPRTVFTSYTFGVATYYSQNLASSVAEYNLAAASLPYSTYSSFGLTINPSSFYVYASTSTTLSYKNQVFLPAGMVFTYEFPSSIEGISFNPVLVYANGSLQSVNQTSTSLATKTLTFQYNSDIPIGTNISVSFDLKTPTNMGTYNYINLTIDNGGNIYQQCLGYLQLSVTLASPISFSIALTGSANNQSTGAIDVYQFTMVTYIPHPTSFNLFISFPNDTSYLSGYNCSGPCNALTGTVNESTINVTMLNPNASTVFVFKLGYFTNPRSIGQGMLWNLNTYSGSSQIGSGTTGVYIQLASQLTGSLSPNYNYYRSNTDIVVFYLTLFNKLKSGDYFLMQFGSDTYTLRPSTSIKCTTFESCSVTNQSTANVLVVIGYPTISQTSMQQLTIVIDGLISSVSTQYNQKKYFNISTYTASGYLIDQGYVAYNISCGEHPSNNCRECLTNGSCLSCNADFNANLYNGACTNNCSTASQYQFFNGNNTCAACQNNCGTCTSSVNCITCVTIANLLYYLYPSTQTCQTSCNTANGYYISKIGSITYCMMCYDQTYCSSCTSDGPFSCTKCGSGSGAVLQNGQCVTQCTITNSYISSNGVCLTCDAACKECTAGTSADCKVCAYPNLNVSGVCVGSCPVGSVANYTSQTCGCSSKCKTCQTVSTYCLSCANTALLAYLGNCVTSCPLYSYLSGGMCISCTANCLNCTANTCIKCDSLTYAFNNKCYSDCSSISLQYDQDKATMKCVLCPDGCSRCNGSTCSSCLSGYSLMNKSCIKQCIIEGNCVPEVPDKVLPVPGTLAIAVWIVLVIVIKLILKKLYLPYSMMIGMCMVELVLVIACLSVTNNSALSSRLLLGIDYSHRVTVKNLLIASLVFNYISNILYLILFCKYITPLIVKPRQIDYITHIVTLIVGTMTNYRFGLIAFSRMFPKPQIKVDNNSRLTPINYLAAGSVLLDMLPISAAGLLVYKEYPSTNLFMLGVDLMIVIVFMVIITVWMVAVPKSDDYYASDIKRSNTEDNYRTEADMNNNDKSHSYNKLFSVSNINNNLQKIADISNNDDDIAAHSVNNNTLIMMTANEGVQSEEENRPLPTILKSNNPKLENISISEVAKRQATEQDVDQIINFDNATIPNKIMKKGSANKVSNGSIEQKKTKKIQRSARPSVAIQDDHLDRRSKEEIKNFSKEHVKKNRFSPSKKKDPHHQSQILRPKQMREKKLESHLSEEPNKNDYIEPVFLKANHRDFSLKAESNDAPVNVLKGKQKQTRKTGQQSEQKLSMNKKTEVKVFEADSHQDSKSDSLNIEALIASKIKQTQGLDRGLKVQRKQNKVNEDISPSWFNMQNQRFDISEIEEMP